MQATQQKIKKTEARSEEGTVEVLYQKLGDRWFAFSMIGEEVFVGSISQDEIEGGSDASRGGRLVVGNT